MDARRRDLGLRRLSRITRWTVAGSVVATGAFSVLVAHIRPGRPQPVSATTTVPNPGDGGFFQSPGGALPQAPQPARGGGVVSSGAS